MKKGTPKPLRPPKVAEWILKRSISKSIRSRALGDFEEIYYRTAAEKGRFRAWVGYWAQAANSLPSFFKDSLYWSLGMFKNYFKLTVRSIQKHKLHSTINILSLSLGMTVFLFITAFILSEVRHDRFHENFDRIYQIGTSFHNGTPALLAERLKSRFPEIRKIARFRFNYNKNLFVCDGIPYTIKRSYFVDPDVFDIFTFSFIEGNKATALGDPHSIVLTESEAKRIFGTKSPVGKILRTSGEDLLVTAVVADLPGNSHIKFDALLPIQSLGLISREIFFSWKNPVFQTFFLLKGEFDLTRFEDQVSLYINSLYRNLNAKEQAGYSNTEFPLRSFKSLYFDIPRGGNYIHGNYQNVYIYSFLAFLVLCVAIFNFINLSTANASVREKEVGVRKVLGAFRKQLISQFLFESIFLILASIFLAGTFILLTRQSFFNVIGKEIPLGIPQNPWVIAAILFGTVSIGLISGFYPAVYLTSLQPANVIRHIGQQRNSKFSFRNILIIFQFFFSFILIAGTLLVRQQMEYIQSKDLGFKKEQILWFELDNLSAKKSQVIKARLRDNTYIQRIASSGYTKPGIRSIWNMGWKDRRLDLDIFLADQDFIETMGLEITSGRDFYPKSDRNSGCILNETAVRHFGMQEPIGQVVDKYTIVGVVKDFHFRSLHHPISPLILIYDRKDNPIMNVRIQGDSEEKAIEGISRTLKAVAPNVPLEYHFLDDSFDGLYYREKKFERLIRYFAAFAIVIACLGLFGLTSFMSEKKTKEVGIRKVLGASSGRVMLLLSRDFLKWVLIAIVFAWPAAWFGINRWLQHFSYRTRLEVWVFLLSGLITFAVALLTVCIKGAKTSRADPVISLRDE
jgi:putative ABC transport system permease protein